VQRGGEVCRRRAAVRARTRKRDRRRREAGERLRAAEARLANLQTGKRPVEVEVVAEQLQQRAPRATCRPRT
jgi:hypothetical protein